MVLLRKSGQKRNQGSTWRIIHEEGREEIQQWRDKRRRMRKKHMFYHHFRVYAVNLDTLKSFAQNINFMVVIQIILAVVSVYIFQILDVSFDIPVNLFVTPIAFPLAFSINTDFQRREKVLEDLAVFKSSGMVWYTCMREWKVSAALGTEWIIAVRGKLKSLLFHLHEYLFTEDLVHRQTIVRVMCEDFSDVSQLIEELRNSKLPANSPLVSRAVHLLNTLCLSFERLRVIREYRSPRSIRSFTKVSIMLLPVILAPYFIFLGKSSENKWEAYYISGIVALIFSVLQSVQDKLDDPFDGMSEDDINLDTIDEWAQDSLEHTMKRNFDSSSCLRVPMVYSKSSNDLSNHNDKEAGASDIRDDTFRMRADTDMVSNILDARSWKIPPLQSNSKGNVMQSEISMIFHVPDGSLSDEISNEVSKTRQIVARSGATNATEENSTMKITVPPSSIPQLDEAHFSGYKHLLSATRRDNNPTKSQPTLKSRIRKETRIDVWVGANEITPSSNYAHIDEPDEIDIPVMDEDLEIISLSSYHSFDESDDDEPPEDNEEKNVVVQRPVVNRSDTCQKMSDNVLCVSGKTLRRASSETAGTGGRLG